MLEAHFIDKLWHDHSCQSLSRQLEEVITQIIHVNQVRFITCQLWTEHPRPFIDTSTISQHSQEPLGAFLLDSFLRFGWDVPIIS